MAELSQQTLQRLNRFRQSEKFSQLNPQTQNRLNNFLSKSETSIQKELPVKSPIESGFEMASEAVKSIPGIGMRELLPGTESPIVKRGVEASQGIARRVASPLPTEPSLETPMGSINPRTAGEFLVGGAIDPRSLAGAFGGSGLAGVLSKLGIKSSIPFLRGRALSKASKAERLTEQLLKPEQKEFAKQIRHGDTTLAVKEASKVIKKTKDYTGVTRQLEESKKIPMQERQSIYERSATEPEFSQLNPILEESKISFKSGQADREGTVLNKMWENELNWLKSQKPEDLANPDFIQARKEYHQAQAAPFYEAVQKGADPTRINPRLKGFDKLAEGYQSKLSALAEEVEPLNLQFKGRKEASERASTLAAIERGAEPHGISQELVNAIRPTPENFIATMLRQLLRQTVKGRTKGIEKASRSSRRSGSLADLLEGLITETPDAGVLENPAQLALPEPQRKLTAPSDRLSSIVERMRQQRTEKEFGIPEYAPPKERNVPIQKVPRAGKTGMEARVRQSLKSLAERRRKNG